MAYAAGISLEEALLWGKNTGTEIRSVVPAKEWQLSETCAERKKQ